MKLSEAIREGAKLRPQAFGSYFNKNGRSCALGAAYEACTGEKNIDLSNPTFWNAYPELLEMQRVDSPYESFSYLKSAILYLNDRAKWTREQIADFVEQQGF
jgi:hypothetical protein